MAKKPEFPPMEGPSGGDQTPATGPRKPGPLPPISKRAAPKPKTMAEENMHMSRCPKGS